MGCAIYAVHHFELFALDPLHAALLGCVGLLASLFPDVDTNSKGQHLFYSLLALAMLGLMWEEAYKWAAILGFVAMLPAISRHRGFTHRWWAALAIPAMVLSLPVMVYGTSWEAMVPWYVAAVLGYGSHLALDALA